MNVPPLLLLPVLLLRLQPLLLLLTQLLPFADSWLSAPASEGRVSMGIPVFSNVVVHMKGLQFASTWA